MKTRTSERAQKHRRSMRSAGLRPIQIWVPDTRRIGFAELCRKQSLLAAEAERKDTELMDFIEKALADIEGGAI